MADHMEEEYLAGLRTFAEALQSEQPQQGGSPGGGEGGTSAATGREAAQQPAHG